MKLSSLKSKTIKSNLFYLSTLFLFFLIFIFFNRQKLFQQFDPEVVNRYLRSQDIVDTDNKIKDRIFISDEEIYIATGYLYANGAKPTEYNFPHTPLIKYLFGFSSKYFNLPLLPNILFAAILLFEIYLLGKLTFKSELVGFVAALGFLLDPVFKEVTIYALLDLGQIIFILGFIITSFYYSKHYIGRGLLLGLALASKFYSPVIIILGLVYIFKFINKQFNWKHELLVLIIASLTFSLTYIRVWPFDIVFHQAKMIKFMVDHNHAVTYGGVVKMFLGGYFLWPVLLLINIHQLSKVSLNSFFAFLIIMPLVYFLIMCFQLPFTRYFVLILPFMYLVSSKLLCEKLLHN